MTRTTLGGTTVHLEIDGAGRRLNNIVVLNAPTNLEGVEFSFLEETAANCFALLNEFHSQDISR
jgi:hypothetical protein